MTRRLILVIAMSACLMASAQTGRSLDDEITVIATYRPALADAVKVRPKAVIPDDKSAPVSLEYSVPEEYLRVSYSPPPVKAVAMPVEPPVPVPNVFAKIGAGNKALPFIDVHVNSGFPENTRADDNRTVWTAHTKYINSTGGALENQKYSELRTGLSAKRYLEYVAISGGLFFDQDMVHFYGYDNDSLSFAARDVRQTFKLIGGDVRLMSTEENDARIIHDTRFRMSYLADRFGQRELNPQLTVKLDKELENGNRILGKALVDHTGFSSDSMKQSHTIVGINPKFRLQRDIWYAEAGFNSGGDEHGFFFFPDLAFERELLGKGFVLYAGWNGAPRFNSFRSLTATNPFIAENVSMTGSREQDRFIGFKGNPAHGFGYNVKVSNKAVRNLPLFLNDTDDFKRFMVVYDSSAIINQVHGEISVSHGEKLRMILSGDFFSFTLSNQPRPWHLPTLTARVHMAYRATQRLGLSLDIFAFNSTKAKQESGATKELPGLTDINIGGTFRMSESFFIFASVNNVASIKHERWYNYPGYGFNAIGGIGLSF